MCIGLGATGAHSCCWQFFVVVYRPPHALPSPRSPAKHCARTEAPLSRVRAVVRLEEKGTKEGTAVLDADMDSAVDGEVEEEEEEEEEPSLQTSEGRSPPAQSGRVSPEQL